MDKKSSEEILSEVLGFDNQSLKKLKIFHDNILKFNKKYNIIARSTEKEILFCIFIIFIGHSLLFIPTELIFSTNIYLSKEKKSSI